MNYFQFVEFCVSKGIPKEKAIRYCDMTQQGIFTEYDYKQCKEM